MSLNLHIVVRLIVNSLAVILFAPSLGADQVTDDGREDLYQIEFILFKQAAPDLSVLEYEKSTSALPDAKEFLTVFPYLTQPLSPYQRAGLSDSAELSLAETAERLVGDGYSVLMQGAWHESIGNDSRSLPIRLSSEKRPFSCPFWSWICNRSMHQEQNVDSDGSDQDLEVDVEADDGEQFFGQLVIRRSRYMHAELHIDYYFKQRVLYKSLLEYLGKPAYDQAPLSALVVPSGTYDDVAAYGYESSSLINVRSFTFKQSRRVKNNEIHYLDHPYLGMIVSIKRIDQEEAL